MKNKILYASIFLIAGGLTFYIHQFNAQKKIDILKDVNQNNNSLSSNSLHSQSSSDRYKKFDNSCPMSLKELSKVDFNEIVSHIAKSQSAGSFGEVDLGLFEEISRRPDIEASVKANIFNQYLGDSKMDKASFTYVNAVDEMLWMDRSAKHVLDFLNHLNDSSLKDDAYSALFAKYIKNADNLKEMLPHIVNHKEYKSLSVDANLANRLSRIIRRILELDTAQADRVSSVINEYPLSEMTKYLLNENLKRRNVDIQFQ